MNIGFNYVPVFVSIRKVNLSAQLLHVVMVKKHSSKVGGTQLYRKGPKVVRRKQKVGNPCCRDKGPNFLFMKIKLEYLKRPKKINSPGLELS